MDSSKKNACPWGAPLTPTQWGGSPVPSLLDSSHSSPRHSNSPGPHEGPRTPNSGNLSGGQQQRFGDGQRTTPGSHSHSHPSRQQRASPYHHQQQPHSNRMRLPSLDGGSPQSSPRHFQPRSHFQNSPRFGTPSGQYNPRYMNSPGSGYRPRSDFTPSPRQGFSSGRKSFTPRHGYPSQSFDASQYVHTSMLEDPWRNLPPKPLLKQY